MKLESLQVKFVKSACIYILTVFLLNQQTEITYFRVKKFPLHLNYFQLFASNF